MYLEHFKLKEFPFRLTPDTDFLYMSPSHARAISYMEYAVFNQEGFVVITGEIGSGKTTLIQKLLREMDKNINVAKIFQTQLDEVEFLQAVLVEFGMNPFSAKKVELLNMLNQYLINSYMNDKRVVLIVDDAQNLSKKVLEEICMLSGVETQKEKILHVILVGQPELNLVLESTDMEQLLQRISLRYHMRPLKEAEIHNYIKHRLRIAGSATDIFKDLAKIFFQYTGGTPRLINTLCDTCMTCAYADDVDVINDDIVKTAIEELQWKEFGVYKAESKLNQEKVGRNLNSSDNAEAADSNPSDHVPSKITSMALVDISVQLKRLADILENKYNK